MFADPYHFDHFDADPDPAFHFDANTAMAFHLDGILIPDPGFASKNLSILTPKYGF